MTSSIMIKLGISVLMVGAMPVSGHVLNAAHESIHPPAIVLSSQDAIFTEKALAPKTLKVVQNQTVSYKVSVQPIRSTDTSVILKNSNQKPSKTLASKTNKYGFGIKNLFSREGTANDVEQNSTRSPKPPVKKTHSDYKKHRPSLGTMVGVFR